VACRGITVYGCGPHEAALVRRIAHRLGVRPTIVDEPVSEANVDLAAGDRSISVDHKTAITPPLLQALDHAGVQHISTRSIGVNHVDLGAAGALGISVSNVGYSPDSVADFTLMLILMSVRGAASSLRRVDAHDYRSADEPGRELRDLTIGVVGTGRIGAAVIERLRGFGGRILAFDQRPTASVDYVALPELLAQSDVVTLHLPLDAGTHHLLDRRRLEQMRPGAHLINTGRGGLIETAALVEALEGGRLAGAALDVLEGEDGVFYTDRRRAPADHPLLQRLQQLPNVIISPHTAYRTDHALRDAVEASLLSCVRFEAREHHG
jgi:D-specific alpha-keto acid dehydrogenase